MFVIIARRILTLISAFFFSVAIFAQLPRSNEFHKKYTLKEVVVMSRHNIRAPLSTEGSPINRITPNKWTNWTAPAGQLSLRGGVMETAMGQFFRKWVLSENLLPDNYIPTGEEIYFYTNSLQRTFATGKYFSAGFLPYANIKINRRYNENRMDPVFTPKFTKMTKEYKAEVERSMNAMGGKGGFKTLMRKVEPQLQLMATVTDLEHSPACTEGDTCHFFYEDTKILIVKDDEPRMQGGYALANSTADALILQYYEMEDSVAAAFGHRLTSEQWRQFGEIKSVYDDLLFTSHIAAINLAYPLVSRIYDEINNDKRKFVFLCGHDSNLASLRGALYMLIPYTHSTPEVHTPIGSKYVFEKWSDGNDLFVAVNLVYPSANQLRTKAELTPASTPVILPVSFQMLSPNADGLYPLIDFNDFLKNTMKEFYDIDANQDISSAINCE